MMPDEIETMLRQAAKVDVTDAADAALRGAIRAADRAGVVDVTVATMDSPFGEILLAVTRRGLVRVAFQWHEHGDVVEDLTERLSPRLVESPERLDDLRRQFDDYFEGRRRKIDVRVDYSLAHGFRRQAMQAARRIPVGHTETYGEVAERVGHPRAARAVGTAMAQNPVAIVVPCHRVVPAGGGVGSYGGGPAMKQALLEMEGAL